MTSSKPEQFLEDFGEYAIGQRLGMGGMATVHSAIHRATGQRVAIKRLLPQFARDRELIAQFIREAEIASALSHPNIVKVWEHGRVGKMHYIVMERLEGQSLLSLLRRANEDGQPAPIGVSLSILREVLSALDYATNGKDSEGRPFNIIHRDLSPSNMIVTNSGCLKIIDFGVARSLQGRYATNSGNVKGKLGYMSPEILAGRKFDCRSDLFSASVVAWELLTAKRLFRGSEREQLKLRAQNYELTPPSTYNHWVPNEVDALLAIALAENPSSRWPSAGAMLDALQPQLRRHGTGASTESVLAWMDRLQRGEKVLLDSNTGIHQSKDAMNLHRNGPASQTIQKKSVFQSITTAIRAPRDKRFKPDITTMHDLGCAPPLDHETGQTENQFALGSSEFPRQSAPLEIEDKTESSEQPALKESSESETLGDQILS